QVDFLDRHPDHAIVFHDLLVLDEDGGRAPRRFCEPALPRTSTLTDLLGGNFIPTSAALVRKTWHRLPDWLPSLALCDWPLHLIAAAAGRIGYQDEVMGVYRIHAGGASRRLVGERYLDGKIEILKRIHAHLGFRYEKVIRAAVARAWVDSVLSEEKTD